MSKTKIISVHLKIVSVVTKSQEIFSIFVKLMSCTICFWIFKGQIRFSHRIIGNSISSFVKKIGFMLFLLRIIFPQYYERASIVSFHHLNYLEGIFFYYWDTGETGIMKEAIYFLLLQRRLSKELENWS